MLSLLSYKPLKRQKTSCKTLVVNNQMFVLIPKPPFLNMAYSIILQSFIAAKKCIGQQSFYCNTQKDKGTFF